VDAKVSTDEGKRHGYEIIVEDVTRQHEVEDDLRQQAAKDPLTGLSNYRHLHDVLANEVNRFKRAGREFALVFFDLDKLKADKRLLRASDRQRGPVPPGECPHCGLPEYR